MGLNARVGFTVKDLSGNTAAWLRRRAGGEAGSTLVRTEPEDPLSQPAVVVEEPVEEQSAKITTEEVLVLNEAYQNVGFSGQLELEDGVSGSEGERVAPQGFPSAVQAVCSPQVPSGKPAATEQEVYVPLLNVDPEELSFRGRRALSQPGKNECIPLLTREQRLRGAGAGSATAPADPVSTPEAAMEAFFQLLGHIALPEPAMDARILLEDQAVVAETFVGLFGDEEENLFTEKRSEESSGAAEEEARL